MSDFSSQPNNSAPSDEFVGWLSTQIGAGKWIVARRSKARIALGYETFLTQTRFAALHRHFQKEVGEVETDDLSKHLTETDMAFAQKRKDTHAGMAYWAGTGPEGKTCRGCTRWEFDGYAAGSKLLKESRCAKYKSLMHGAEGDRVPHYAKACKYFEESGHLHPVEKPKASAAASVSSSAAP